MYFQIYSISKELLWSKGLTLKAPITTAADGKFCDIFPTFRKNKV